MNRRPKAARSVYDESWCTAFSVLYYDGKTVDCAIPLLAGKPPAGVGVGIRGDIPEQRDFYLSREECTAIPVPTEQPYSGQ
jgi:hypothetical protein